MFNPKRLNQWVEEQLHEPEFENEKQKRNEKTKKTNRKNKRGARRNLYGKSWEWESNGARHVICTIDLGSQGSNIMTRPRDSGDKNPGIAIAYWKITHLTAPRQSHNQKDLNHEGHEEKRFLKS